jgi:hypothetical protein
MRFASSIAFCPPSLASFFFASLASFALFFSAFTSSLSTFSNRALSTSTLLLVMKSVVLRG